jgi:hypothetical protein
VHFKGEGQGDSDQTGEGEHVERSDDGARLAPVLVLVSLSADLMRSGPSPAAEGRSPDAPDRAKTLGAVGRPYR